VLTRTLIHGTDKGNATFTALILVMVISSVFIAFAGQMNAFTRFAGEYKTRAIAAIEESNREVLSKYDIR